MNKEPKDSTFFVDFNPKSSLSSHGVFKKEIESLGRFK